MIKQINKQNVLTTPFVTIKEWELYNIQNEDSVLIEPYISSVQIDDTLVALDFIDYNNGNPLLNRDCNIALEQQETDMAIYQEGINKTGIFYPDNEPKNNDGTYKRLVYSQINSAFYNKYKNPVQIFGIDYIDFQLSNTIRYIADEFRMFTIPQNIFGERIVPNSVYLYDNSLDDNIEIKDDGFQNLIAGKNLFSKIQEVRGNTQSENFINLIVSGSAINNCIYDLGDWSTLSTKWELWENIVWNI